MFKLLTFNFFRQEKKKKQQLLLIGKFCIQCNVMFVLLKVPEARHQYSFFPKIIKCLWVHKHTSE